MAFHGIYQAASYFGFNHQLHAMQYIFKCHKQARNYIESCFSAETALDSAFNES